MDYSLLIGIERDENQKDFQMIRKASYLEDKKDSTLSFQQSRFQDRLDMKSSSLNSNFDTEQDPMKKFDRTSRKAHVIKGKTETIHMSIIDYLQEWNLNKKVERAYKVHLLQKSGSGLSAIEPN